MKHLESEDSLLTPVLRPHVAYHSPQSVLADLLALVPRIASCWAKTVTLPLKEERKDDDARLQRLRLTYAELKREEAAAEADSEEMRQGRPRESSVSALAAFPPRR